MAVISTSGAISTCLQVRFSLAVYTVYSTSDVAVSTLDIAAVTVRCAVTIRTVTLVGILVISQTIKRSKAWGGNRG